MADRFFLNALVRKNRRLPAPAPGAFSTDAPKGDFLGHFAADILVEGQVQDARAVSSVPSVFARPIQFLQALASKEHPLHDALVRQWRGLLAVFALSDYLGLPVTTTPFEVPKKADEDDAAASLVTILRAQLPRPPEDWERFWLLRCDGQLIGATSPWTVVYTPADYRCPASIPWRDGDGLLGDPLEHYRKVGGLQVELTLLCHYLDQVLEDRWGFERRLDDKAAAIKRELTAFRKELDKYREGHMDARGLGAPRIDVWPYRSFLRAVQAEAEQAAPQSTLLLAAGQAAGAEPTLLLPRTGLAPTRRVHQSVLYQDLDLGRMPPEGKAGWQTPAGRTVPLPYMVPEEVLLPRRLVELTLSDRALHRGGVEIALPLTPAFLRFFRYDDLKAQPDLLSVTTDRQDIVVRLRLPVFGEAPLTVERRYRRGIDTARVPTPVLALWPDFYSPDFSGNVALYCGDGDLSVRPLLDGGATLESSGAGPGQRLWTHKAPPIGFALYLKDSPAGIVLRESLPAPEKLRSDRTWTVAVDFGTSNTHVLVDEGGGNAPPLPLDLRGRTLCLTEAREEFREALRYFYPQTAPKLPLVTLLVRNQATLLGERSDERYTPLFTFYPDLLTSQGTVKNVKWGGSTGVGGTDAESPLRAYLLGLLRYIAAEARARGVSEVQYRWSYPLALPEGARGAMAGFWSTVEPFSTALKVLPSASASESEAACRYLSQPKLGILPVGSSALSIVVDVGGGSSDIGFWTRGRLLEQLSFYLAANHLTEEIVRFEGLAQTLFRICSGQIESTYEAARPAFEAQPTIMFNAVVSQARGWSGGDPQEHPVVKELFGGTLAPHGGPPWVHARGLIYLLFTGLGFYCGVHARRLLAAEAEPAGIPRDERRFFLYFGGRGSSLLSWLSRSGEGLGRLLSAAFREGLSAEGPLPGLDVARCRVEVMGPPIDYRDKAPPKEEVAGGLLCPPLAAAEARGARPPERQSDRHNEALMQRFLDKVAGAAAPGGPLQELNLDLRSEALRVDPDKVQHRVHHAAVHHPIFIHELEVLLQAYLESLPGRRGR